jgi:F0F1-type ATP synthase membrane subunit b/b'
MATAKKTVNKSEYIRKHPNTPASELIAQAKKEGITLTAAQIYTTRSEAKRKAGGAPEKAGRPAKVARLADSGRGTGNGIEQMLRQLVREEIKAYFTER